MCDEGKTREQLLNELTELRRQLAELQDADVERRRQEELLRKSEEQYRALAEHSSEVIMRFDRQFRHLYTNSAIRGSTGLSPEDFIGKTHKEVGFSEEDCLFWERAIQTVFDTGLPHQVQFQFAGIDGQVVFAWSLMPEFGADGTVQTVMTTSRDITKLVRAEDALRESEARFRRLAENAQDIIYRYELYPTRRSGYVGPAVTKIIGYTPEEHYADPNLALKIVDPEYRLLLLAVAEGRIPDQPVTVKWRHKDGHTVWTEERLVPVYDGEGRLIAAEGIARDVTERKKMEQQLIRAQRLEAAGRIAGQVAHDFNNLLGPITAYPELIKMQLPAGHPSNALCDLMLQAAEQIAEINSQMLALGRRGRVNQEPTDLNGVVELAISHLPELPVSLKITLDLAKDLMPVMGSQAQLLRLVVNLVSNARDAMGDVGRVTVRTEDFYLDRPVSHYNRLEMGEYVKLSISDDGCGIDPGIRDKIFDAFFTTKRTDRTRGSGLGLSVVQAIVDDHAGYLDLESNVGVGSSFFVYLPVCRQPIKDVSHDGLPLGHETILLVDDDPLQRNVASRMLETLGYRVDAADGGEEAVRWLRDHQADLVALDMIMPPGMDGAETYRQILRVRPGQKAIILSGFAESDRVQVAQSLGAGCFLSKPVKLETLARAVRAELDQTT